MHEWLLSIPRSHITAPTPTKDWLTPSLSILAVNGAIGEEDLPVSVGRNKVRITTVAPDISPPSRAFRQGKTRGSQGRKKGLGRQKEFSGMKMQVHIKRGMREQIFGWHKATSVNTRFYNLKYAQPASSMPYYVDRVSIPASLVWCLSMRRGSRATY